MCKLIENHCQILKIENSWPAEFNCENDTLYPAKLCKVNHSIFIIYTHSSKQPSKQLYYNVLFVYSSYNYILLFTPISNP